MVNLVRRMVTVTDGESLQSVIDELALTYGEVPLSGIIFDVYDEAYLSFSTPETEQEIKTRIRQEKAAEQRRINKLTKEKEEGRKLFLQLKAIYEPADTDSP